MTHNEIVRKLEEIEEHVKTLERLLAATVANHVKLLVRAAIQRRGFTPSFPAPPAERVEEVIADIIDDLKPFSALGFDSRELLDLAYDEAERLLTHRS